MSAVPLQRSGVTAAPADIPIVYTILCRFVIILKLQSLLFHILTLVCLSPALLRLPSPPQTHRAGKQKGKAFIKILLGFGATPKSVSPKGKIDTAGSGCDPTSLMLVGTHCSHLDTVTNVNNSPKLVRQGGTGLGERLYYQV